MREPTAFQWLIGNPVVGGALTVLGIAGIIGGLTGHVPLIVAVPVLAIGIAAGNAMTRVNAYRRWQREWNAMVGESEVGERTRMPSRHVLHRLAATILWLILAFWSLQVNSNDLWLLTAAMMFWLGSAFIVLALVIRLLGGDVSRRRASSIAAVQVCLTRPLCSPSLKEAYSSASETKRPTL